MACGLAWARAFWTFLRKRMQMFSVYRKTKCRNKKQVLEDLKTILTPENGVEPKGEDFIRKAKFILSDVHKSYEVILHDLMALGTEAFRAEC